MATKAAQKTERAWKTAYNKYISAYNEQIAENPIFGSAGIVPYTFRQFQNMYAAVQNTKGYGKSSDAKIIERLMEEQKSIKFSYAQAQNMQRAMGLYGIVYSIDEIMAGITGEDARAFDKQIQDRYKELRSSGLSTKECAKIISQEFFGSA